MTREEWDRLCDVLEALPTADLHRVMTQSALLIAFRANGMKNEKHFTCEVHAEPGVLFTDLAIWFGGGRMAKDVRESYEISKARVLRETE